jgi:deoxyribose-phosphate aldolase
MENLNQYIDHTLLKPQATADDFVKLCNEAKEYNFKAVCVPPSQLKLCRELLKDSDILLCTVVGFPLGHMTLESKVFETQNAVELGANEVDMVINISAFKNGEDSLIETEVKNLASICHSKGAILKVILETCLLTDEEITKLCKICEVAGADFVKTSTGFSTHGATLEHVKLMRESVSSNIGIKASGGIKNTEDAKKMIERGATRIGTSSGVAIVTDS